MKAITILLILGLALLVVARPPARGGRRDGEDDFAPRGIRFLRGPHHHHHHHHGHHHGDHGCHNHTKNDTNTTTTTVTVANTTTTDSPAVDAVAPVLALDEELSALDEYAARLKAAVEELRRKEVEEGKKYVKSGNPKPCPRGKAGYICRRARQQGQQTQTS